MSMETDSVPIQKSLVNDFYNQNKNKRYSTSSSSETISSVNSTDREQVTNDLQNENLNPQCSYVDDPRIKINRLKVNESSDIHVGSKIYNGPVIIKQHILINDNEQHSKEHDNRGFESSDTNLNNDEKKSKVVLENRDNQQSICSLKFLYSHWRVLLIIVFFCVISIIAVLMIISYLNKPEEFYMVDRKQWNATDYIDTPTYLSLPVEMIIIAHTATADCTTKRTCSSRVLSIQKFHLLNYSFSDIGYNFLIGGDGNIYEGRGWDIQGAHTSGYNRISLGVAYIGNFVEKIPNEKQLRAGFLLFDEAVRKGALKIDYKIVGACQLRSTESPGKFFFELIQSWKHWSDDQ